MFYKTPELHLKKAALDMNQMCVLVPLLAIMLSFWHTQASLKKLISMGRNLESVEESICSMITQLITRMCTPFKGNGNFSSFIMILTVFFFSSYYF